VTTRWVADQIGCLAPGLGTSAAALALGAVLPLAQRDAQAR
jgi:hypothetical protein